MGAIDEAATDLRAAVAGADLIILCTPVGLFGDILTGIASQLSEGAIVTDVGSTKRSVVKEAAKRLPSHARFVGSHPMAGSEKRGVEFAKADLFQGALCLVTPDAQTDAVAIQQVEGFWRLLGMRTARLTPEEHDRLVADVSHVPHAVAAALVTMQEEAALRLAGRGFLDATRIAGGDGGLWRDILLDNRDNVKSGIWRLRAELDQLLARFETGDADVLKQWLDSAADRREQWLRKKLEELNPE